MKNRRLVTMLTALGVAVAMTVSGCGAANAPAKEEVKEEVVETVVHEEPWVFTDSCGREVEIPAAAERIVPMGPPAQMMLLSLAPEKVVGLTKPVNERETKYLGEAIASLPVFGSFYGSGDLNMEALAASEPELIIDIGEAKNGNVDDLNAIQEQLGIPVIFIEASLETTGEAFRTLGEVLATEEYAAKLGKYCDEKLAMVKDGMTKVKDEDKLKYLYTGGDNGLFVISKDSFHAEVLDMLGENVAVLDQPTRKGTGDEVSAEQMLLWEPDIVLFSPKSVYETAKEDEVLGNLKAIKEDRYYEVPVGPFNWMGLPPAVNRFMGLLWAANVFYPEVFDYDMYDVTKEYYDLFYHYDLTEDDFAKLTANAVK